MGNHKGLYLGPNYSISIGESKEYKDKVQSLENKIKDSEKQHIQLTNSTTLQQLKSKSLVYSVLSTHKIKNAKN